MLEKNLIRANEDIVTVSTIAQSMGWGRFQNNLSKEYCIWYKFSIHSSMKEKIYFHITILQ